MAVDVPAIDSLLCLLHKCRNQKNLDHPKLLYACLLEHELIANFALGNLLVSALVACRSLPDAHHVFDCLPRRNDHSWNTLISGYVDCEEPHQAFILYGRMCEDPIQPDQFTFMPLLRACTRLKDTEKGRGLHDEIIKRGLAHFLFIGNTLVHMYGNCSLLAEAQGVLEKLTVRDAVSWNALITEYADHGLGDKALNCLEQMQLEGIAPDAVTLVCSLKACGSTGNIAKCQQLCMEVTRKGLENHLFVGNTLIDMFMKCDLFAEARKVFDNLPDRDTVSWNAMILGYTDHGLFREALSCFDAMRLQPILPDVNTFISGLKACGSIGDMERGQRLFSEIVEVGLEKDLFVGSMMVDLYAKCGMLGESREVFEHLSVQDTVLWTVLISGYAECGLDKNILACFDQMLLKGIHPDANTYVSSLKACSSTKALERGWRFHMDIVKKGFECNLLIGNSLIDMFGNCNSPAEAHWVFDKLPQRNIVSWNALIAGYAEHGLGEEALMSLEQIEVEGLSPNTVTFVSSLKACSSMGSPERGQKILAKVVGKGCETDLAVANTLVDMFGKCGLLLEAQEQFAQLPVRDLVSWNALISGYADHGLAEDAWNCLEQMQADGVSPDAVTLICNLKACGSIGTLNQGHMELTKRGLERDLLVVGTLVDVYAKCVSLADARDVLEKVPARDAVLWASLISGYADEGLYEDVLACFEQMRRDRIPADAATYAHLLKACGALGALEMGQEIHAELKQLGLGGIPFLGNTLIDMYCRCGSLAEGREVFDKLTIRDAVTWNAMIKGYGENHEGNMAIQCFEGMQEQGVKPDAITFICLLVACSHACLISKGQEYFQAMKEHGVEPSLEHYICLVDLIARSGHIFDVESFAEECPASKEIVTVLLSSCKTFGRAEVGLKCFEQLICSSPEDASSYLLMTDIYASAGRLSDANRVEELRKNIGATKKLAGTLIEVDKKVHKFVVGNDQSTDTLRISETIFSRMKGKGFIPNLDLVSRHKFDEDNGVTSYDHVSQRSVL